MKRKATIVELRRQIVGDSIERKKLVEKLIKAVREDERQKYVVPGTDRTSGPDYSTTA